MDNRDIPYIVYEGSMMRAERHIRRLIIALVISLILMVISNTIWLVMWNQYDYSNTTESTYEQDGEGINIIGDSNDVTKSNNKTDSNED